MVKILWPLPFSLDTCLNAHMKDNGFMKSVIPLTMEFSIKITISFYDIFGIWHQFEHNHHDHVLWLRVPLYTREI